MSSEFRYEISILIGPCTQEEAEAAALDAHLTVTDITHLAPATALNYWDEDLEQPGLPVANVEVLG